MTDTKFTPELVAQLQAPFPDDEVLHGTFDNGKPYRYTNVQSVYDRLNTVAGIEGWSAEFEPILASNGVVACKLTVLGVTRTDYGYPNRPGSPQALKDGLSDAVKRAARQFGIGAYLWKDTPQSKAVTYVPGNDLTVEPTTAAPGPSSAVLTLASPNTGREQRAVLPATEPQIKAIFTIARVSQAMDEAEIETRCQELYGVRTSGLSRRQASDFIDVLKGYPSQM